MMNEVMTLVIANLEKVGLGVALFLCAYAANMGLGAWRNVKVEGWEFDWRMMAQSMFKFIVIAASIALLSMVVSALPAYATFVGIEIEAETLHTMDSLIIIGAFLGATIRYVADALGKIKDILG